jgi:hypothetical protein
MDPRRRTAVANSAVSNKKPSCASLKRPVRDELGKALRAMYAELIAQPVPDRLGELAMRVRGPTRTLH